MKKHQLEQKPKPTHKLQRYLKRVNYGDIGVVNGERGRYLIVDFKVKGRLAVPISSIDDESYVESTVEEYNDLTEEIVGKHLIRIYIAGSGIGLDGEVTEKEAKSEVRAEKREAKKPMTATKAKVIHDTGARGVLNSKTIDELIVSAKESGIDITKYSHLKGGLLKMTLVNVLIKKV